MANLPDFVKHKTRNIQLNNPFLQDKVKSITLNYDEVLFSNPREYRWIGWVNFKNNNQSGRFETEKHNELIDCLMEIESFVKSLPE